MLILSPDMVIWLTNQRQLNAATMGKEFKAATPEDEHAEPIPVKTQQVIGSDVYCGVLKHMGRACPLLNLLLAPLRPNSPG